LYILLDPSVTGAGTVLARFDPRTAAIETAPLAFSYAGEVRMAWGADGLYLAAVDGTAGRWLLDRNALAQALWEDWPDARVRTVTGATLKSLLY
jgi:hypothetical protein